MRYYYPVEPGKAIEYAEEKAAFLADLLRYALSVVYVEGKAPRIGLKGEIARGRRLTLAVASDGADYRVATRSIAKYRTFEITQAHVDILHDTGIFEMAQLLSQWHHSLTEIEALLKHCIGWFSLSQTQKDKSSEFLNLVIILEVLLTPSATSAPITATIADGVAILLADSEDERRKIKKTTREIYDIRSRLVHGNLIYSGEDFDTDLEHLRNIVIKLIMTVWELKARNMLKNETKNDLIELVNSVKFQGPSVLT